jgi:galactonate dehydratase
MYREGFWPVLDQHLMDIIMPDVTIIGGISELKKVAAMAEARNIPTAPHGPFGPVTIASGVQAMATHPEFLILEYAWGEVPWRHDLLLPSEQIVNGRIKVPDRPGLGVELNPEAVKKYRANP